MSHMMADSTDELLAMADRIGLNRKWLQRGGTSREHFDVSKAYRLRAIAAGALPVSPEEIVDRMSRRRGDAGPRRPEGDS